MYIFVVLLTELTEIVDKLGNEVVSNTLGDKTTETSGDELFGSPGSQKFLTKKTYKMKQTQAADKPARIFVSGHLDAAGKQSHFFASFVARMFCCRHLG